MSVIDTAKEAVMLVQKIDNIELYKKILELQSDALKLVEENGNLKGEIQELEEAFKIKDTLLFENNHYYVVKDDTKQGPYCTYCWDTGRKLVRLHQDEEKWWWCLIHQKARHYMKFA
jgi:hypothetical protein